MTIEPTNLTAQLHYRAAGNPPSTLPDAAVSNAFPGLEFDFRNIWRRLLEGIELHEARGFVVSAPDHPSLAGQFLLAVGEHSMLMDVRSPGEPDGQTFMEWSNALADVVADNAGQLVACTFTADDPDGTQVVELRVRPLFVLSEATQSPTALIDEILAQPGELTQSLCSPWQNDYVECACYYWAASRPDFVNVQATAGASAGEEWLEVTSETYEQLFRGWQRTLRFIVGGRDGGQ